MKKFSTKVNYCPVCGSKNIYICPRCFREIQDLGPSHRLCEFCEAEKQDKIDKLEDSVKKVGGRVVGGAAAIGAIALKAGESELGKAAAKFGKEAIAKVIKIIKTNRAISPGLCHL